MAIDYLPVMLSIDHPHPELEQWVADRFEMLNGRKMQIIRRADMPADALASRAQYAKGWLWDVVPADTRHILYLDYDIVPLRPLPVLPDAPFIAVPDAQCCVERWMVDYPGLAKTGNYFNSGFFVARRDTQPIFEQFKLHVKSVSAQTDPPFDQTTLNLLIQSTVGVTWLSRALNAIVVDAEPAHVATAVNMHFSVMPASMRWTVMRVLYSVLGMRPLV